jgi:hypothetical protein
MMRNPKGLAKLPHFAHIGATLLGRKGSGFLERLARGALLAEELPTHGLERA